MKKNTTRHTLLMSALSLLLCVCMFIGTTFAWFTDSATSGRNTIQSGNLDVVLEYWDGDSYEEVTSTTKLFDDAALWEPGYTEVAYLKVSNAGSLALKYQLAVNVYNETLGKTKTGADIRLSDHLQFKVVESDTDLADTYASREDAQNAPATATKLQTYNSETKALEQKNEADYVALIIYMPETVGNEANHDGVNIPAIEMGVNLFATQFAYEKDSFDETYDDISIVTNYDSLYNGQTYNNSGNYVLTENINLNGIPFFGYDTNNSIDLNGNTINTAQNAYFMTMGSGCTLSIGGEGTVTTKNNFAAFATESSTFNLNGGNYEFGETNEKAPLFAQNSATIVINDGKFVSSDANTPIVYCINGFVEINGGFFQNITNSRQALLGVGNNLNYANNQKITLRGGTFVNWNPMSSAFAQDWPQAPAMIVLADGYEMISETQANGDIWYMVVRM